MSCYPSINDALRALRAEGARLIVAGRDLDLEALCRRVRALGSFAPVLCVCSGSGEQLAPLFGAGADEVLLAGECGSLVDRALALVNESEQTRRVSLSPLVSLDPAQRRLVVRGSELTLPEGPAMLLVVSVCRWGEWIPGETALRDLGAALNGAAGAAHLKNRVHELRRALKGSDVHVEYSATLGIRIGHQAVPGNGCHSSPALSVARVWAPVQQMDERSRQHTDPPSQRCGDHALVVTSGLDDPVADRELKATGLAVRTVSVEADVRRFCVEPGLRCIIVRDDSGAEIAAKTCLQLRMSGTTTPIYVSLSAPNLNRSYLCRAAGADRVLDADDPRRILCALAMVRRNRGALGPVLRCGPFRIDRAHGRVIAGGQHVALSRGDAEILFHLCRYAGTPVGIDYLCGELLGHRPSVVDQDACARRIRRMRAKLGRFGTCIESVHCGYVMHS